MKPRRPFQSVFLGALAAFGPVSVFTTESTRGQTVWVEAESSRSVSLQRHPWWYDQVKKNQLSGGDWISFAALGFLIVLVLIGFVIASRRARRGQPPSVGPS